MELHVIPAGPIGTNAYLLIDQKRREALLIDAPGEVWADVRPILKKHRSRLTELWLTHGHWDHTQGAAELLRATGAVVRAHPADRELFENPGVMAAFLGEDLEVEPVSVSNWLEPGQTLDVLGTTAEVRHVPGHCPGNVLFHFRQLAAAFVGDALFRGGVGRADLPGGDFEQLARSIRMQIYTLPEETVVYPGHGGATTVAEEKVHNPFVTA